MNTLEAHLRALGNGEIKPGDGFSGICWEVFRVFGCNTSEKCKQLMTDWPEFSGNDEYPVHHPLMHPRRAYDCSDLWSDDEYGDARRRLCLWLADQIKEQEE